ncbi:hypothetical protein Tco_0689468 [Tanacetum coccineum]
MPVQTRRQLATDPEMCMFALTMSIVEPKNIKEAMADSAWIEAMQEELHQFETKSLGTCRQPFGKMNYKVKVEEGIDFEESFAPVARLEAKGSLIRSSENYTFSGKLLYGLKQAPRVCHKVVRLGINPMIQPEPEDLPKDNPKLEIAVLSNYRCISITPIASTSGSSKVLSVREFHNLRESNSRNGTDISQKDENPIKKRQNRTRDGKVCEIEAKSKSSLLREEKAKKNIT